MMVDDFEEGMRQMFAEHFVKAVADAERTGMRRDIIVEGLERALKQLREQPPTKQ